MQSFADDLTDYLRDRAGETLRCVVLFSAEGYDVVYVRDDVDDRSFRDRIEEVHANVTGSGERRESAQYRELGQVRATLVLRQGAAILYFPGADDQGVLVSLEPEAAQQLHLFVSECLDLL